MSSITIDEYGQILIPEEISKKLKLQNNDWLKVSVQKDHIVMSPTREADAELIAELINQGIFY